MTDAAEMIALEHRWLSAVQKRDMSTLEEILAADFILLAGRRGRELRSRTEYMEVIRTVYVVWSYELEPLDVRIYKTTAIVGSRYSQKGRMADLDRTGDYLMSDVFMRIDRGWRAVLRHLTPLPPPRRTSD